MVTMPLVCFPCPFPASYASMTCVANIQVPSEKEAWFKMFSLVVFGMSCKEGVEND